MRGLRVAAGIAAILCVPCCSNRPEPDSRQSAKAPGTHETRPSSERLRALVAQLSDGDPARRGAALIGLKDIKDPAAVPLLTAALASAQPPVLDTIIEALSFFPDPRKLPALIAVARRFEASRADRMSAQFTSLGATGAAALLDAISDCTTQVWEQAAFNEWAAQTAGEAGERAFPLLRAAAAHPDRCRRWAAMNALSQYAYYREDECRWGEPCEARKLLERGAQDKDRMVSSAAQGGLEQLDEPIHGHESHDPDDEEEEPLGEDLRAALKSAEPAERIDALQRLAEKATGSGREPAAALLKDRDEGVRLASIAALLEIDRRPSYSGQAFAGASVSIRALIGAIDDASAAVRTKAAEALGAICDTYHPPGGATPPEVAALTRHISDRSHDVCAAAIEALGNLRAVQAIDPVVAVLERRDAGRLRVLAAMALGSIGTSRVDTPLARALGDADANVRYGAADGLSSVYGGHADTRPPAIVVTAMITALGEDAVRDTLVLSLGKAKDPRAVGPLLAVIDKPSPFPCLPCRALAEIGDKSAVAPLIPFLSSRKPETREGVARALGDLKDVRAVKALCAVLKDENVPVRVAAADGLGKIGDRSAVPALRDAATDEAAEVRQAVERALQVLGAGQDGASSRRVPMIRSAAQRPRITLLECQSR